MDVGVLLNVGLLPSDGLIKLMHYVVVTLISIATFPSHRVDKVRVRCLEMFLPHSHIT